MAASRREARRRVLLAAAAAAGLGAALSVGRIEPTPRLLAGDRPRPVKPLSQGWLRGFSSDQDPAALAFLNEAGRAWSDAPASSARTLEPSPWRSGDSFTHAGPAPTQAAARTVGAPDRPSGAAVPEPEASSGPNAAQSGVPAGARSGPAAGRAPSAAAASSSAPAASAAAPGAARTAGRAPARARQALAAGENEDDGGESDGPRSAETRRRRARAAEAERAAAAARARASKRPRHPRPPGFWRFVGRSPLRPPTGARPPEPNPWRRGEPAKLPDGSPRPTEGLPLSALEDLEPPRSEAAACSRAGGHWHGPKDYHEGALWWRAKGRGGVWFESAERRWWLWGGPQEPALVQHQERWWWKRRAVWFLLHDGEPWGWGLIARWGREGLSNRAGAQLLYTKDGTKLAWITPGDGAAVFDLASGRELWRWSESELPASLKAPAPAPKAFAN